MSLAQTTLLGAIAGSTIFLGLPLARMDRIGPRTRVALAMMSVGILAFLFVEVMQHGFTIVEEPVEELAAGHAEWGEAIGYTLMFGIGLFVGLVGLTHVERRWSRRAGEPVPPLAGGAADALTASQTDALAVFEAAAARAKALRTGLVIAGAIGLHNFAEGLAIGVSAKGGEIGLATVLIVGFAIHNATEGFGIVGPLGAVKPSWRWLLAAGVIGGAPTFIGSIVGYHVTSPALELAFYALAGGALLYVIGEIWNGVRRLGHRELAMWFLFGGIMLGLVTELVIEYGAHV
jgi:ZIP family zinc transporter